MINCLLDGYSEKFDFRFVNIGNLKTVYQLENEIIARAMKSSILKQEMMSISKHLDEKMESMRNMIKDELADRKEMFSLIPKIVSQEMEVMKKQHQEEMKKKDEMIKNLIKQFEAAQANN